MSTKSTSSALSSGGRKNYLQTIITLAVLLSLLLTVWPAGLVSAASPLPQDGGKVYTVQAADNLSKIADKYFGTPASWPAIWLATNAKAETDSSIQAIKDPGILQIGQTLWIPDAEEASKLMTEYAAQQPAPAAAAQTLRLATTTSTADSGLLGAILPDFEKRFNATVDVVAVGTGQAIALGVSGDADVILVHARAKEDEFVTNGDGVNRLDVMYNDFIIVGPTGDPAGIAGMEMAKDAFAQIAAKGAQFASRGDDSGTHTKEKSVWTAAGITPDPASGWYQSIGQGMGATLTFANEKQAYTVADRGTWLSMQASLPDLAVMVGGASIAENKDKSLYNPYGVIPVNPEKHPGVAFELATQFAQWLTSVDTQKVIGEYGKDTFGQSLFYPDSEAFHASMGQ